MWPPSSLELKSPPSFLIIACEDTRRHRSSGHGVALSILACSAALTSCAETFRQCHAALFPQDLPALLLRAKGGRRRRSSFYVASLHEVGLRHPPPVPVGPPSSDHLCSPALTCPAQKRPTLRHPGPPPPPCIPLSLPASVFCLQCLIACVACSACLPPPTLSDIWACAYGHASRVVICFQALAAPCAGLPHCPRLARRSLGFHTVAHHRASSRPLPAPLGGADSH